MVKNCVYSISCICGEVFKIETYRSLKVRLEEHEKQYVKVKPKSQVWLTIYGQKRETISPYKMKLNREGRTLRLSHLKEAAHMLGYNELLSRPSIEMNDMGTIDKKGYKANNK